MNGVGADKEGTAGGDGDGIAQAVGDNVYFSVLTGGAVLNQIKDFGFTGAEYGQRGTYVEYTDTVMELARLPLDQTYILALPCTVSVVLSLRFMLLLPVMVTTGMGVMVRTRVSICVQP